jgi:hypothetical protein
MAEVLFWDLQDYRKHGKGPPSQRPTPRSKEVQDSLVKDIWDLPVLAEFPGKSATTVTPANSIWERITSLMSQVNQKPCDEK